MADNNAAIEQKIHAYLADHGGSVEDPRGQTLTVEMAKAVGVEKPLHLSVVLAQLEGDGAITREVRGLRTYRIALATATAPSGPSADGSPPSPADSAPPTNAAAAAPPPTYGAAAGPATNGAPPATATLGRPGQKVSLREWQASQPTPGDPAAAAGTPPTAQPATAAPGRSDEGAAPPVARRRARRARAAAAATPSASPPDAGTATDPAPPVAAGPSTAGATTAAVSPFAAPPADLAPPVAGAAPVPTPPGPGGAAAPAEQQAPRALTLRQALAAVQADPTAAPPSAPPAPGRSDSTERWSAAASPDPTNAAAASRIADASPTDILAGRNDSSETDPSGSQRLRLIRAVPEIEKPPSRTLIALVCFAMAALVVVAVTVVVTSRHASHYEPALGTTSSSLDACSVVTAAQVTAAFGKDAGAPHTVLGECVYDFAANELIVEVARTDAKAAFDGARNSSAQAIPGIGNSAFYTGGQLWVLQGTSLMQLTLGPSPAATPDPKLLTLAKSAVLHLSATS